jgi:hypothetical protein
MTRLDLAHAGTGWPLMNRSSSYLLALVLVLLGMVAMLFLQDPAQRLLGSERAALYVALLGGLLVLAGLILAGTTAIASLRNGG